MPSRIASLFIFLILAPPLIGQNDEAQYKVLSIQRFPKAIFKTFYDFRNYTPDTTFDFESGSKVMIKGGYFRTPPIAKINNSKLIDIWGYLDNGIVYINASNQFYPLTKEQNDFILYHYFQPSIDELVNPDMIAAIILGGLAGMGIYVERHMHGEMFKLKLDFKEGKLTAWNTADVRHFSEEIFFYFSSYSKPGELSLYVDGVHLCSLERGSFYYFQNVAYKSKREICLKSGFEQYCETLSAPDLFGTSIYLCKLKNGIPTMELATKELESSMLKDIYEGRGYEESCE